MKHKLTIEFDSYRKGKDMNIVLKINFLDILTKVSRRRKMKYKTVGLSILNVLPRNSVKINMLRELSDTEKKLVEELGEEHIGSPDVFNLTTLRSNVVRFYNRLKAIGGKEMRDEGFREKGAEDRGSVVVADDFGESKYVTTFLNGSEKWHKDKKFTKHIDQWNSVTFIKYAQSKFEETYGVGSFEYNRVLKGKDAEGKVRSMVANILIRGFKKHNMNNSHVREYIDWVYDIKSTDIQPIITVHLLCSKSLITEWMTLKLSNKHYRKKGKPKMKGRPT